MSKDFLLKTGKNNKIRITAYGGENIDDSPVIIFVHGFKGFKDWGFCPYLAEELANEGFYVITFNFSHNGTGDSLIEFTELDKFAENTFSLEVEELSEVIDAYKTGFFGNRNVNTIGLLGHSRGGAIAILTAAKRFEVKAVSLWASVSTLDRYSESQKKRWKQTGVFEVMNMRTKQVMALNYTLLEDLEKNKNDLLNIEKSVTALKRPLQIIHGEQDLAVPIKEAEQLFSWSDQSKTELIKIPQTGHTFDIVHPFEGTNFKFNNVINFTKSFFRKNLIEEKNVS